MKILAISASPRRGGNSETLLEMFIEGAQSRGAYIEKIVLDELRIRPCMGDGFCHKAGRCCLDDEMRPVYKKIEDADAIVVASPVYFGSVTAQLKILIDRCQAIWSRYYILRKKRKVRKKGVFICISSYKNKRFFSNSEQIIKIFFLVIGAGLDRRLYATGVDKKGDILKKGALLKKAFRMGAALASGFY